MGQAALERAQKESWNEGPREVLSQAGGLFYDTLVLGHSDDKQKKKKTTEKKTNRRQEDNRSQGTLRALRREMREANRTLKQSLSSVGIAASSTSYEGGGIGLLRGPQVSGGSSSSSSSSSAMSSTSSLTTQEIHSVPRNPQNASLDSDTHLS